MQIKAKTRLDPKMVQVELLTTHTPICPHAKIPILHGMGGASRQSGGAAVAASTEKLNTHSADIMRVDVLTAHTPFCPLAAWLRTLPPNKRCDGVVEECLLPYSTLRQEELRLRIWHTAQQSPHVGELGHCQSLTRRYYGWCNCPAP